MKKDVVAKASKVIYLEDCASDEVFNNISSDSNSILNPDLVYEKILDPFLGKMDDIVKCSNDKYGVTIIEPYNFLKTNDSPITEISLALFNLSKFKLEFYYRLNFSYLTNAIIDIDYEKYDYDSVYSELLQYIYGYRRLEKYLISNILFNPVIELSHGFNNYDIAYIGHTEIILPKKISKYASVKYPFKHSAFLNCIKENASIVSMMNKK